MRLLVAEDSATVRGLLAYSLQRWGYQVQIAHDGQEAWRQLQGPDAPRLALLDWEMPGLDGVEVCRLVREREQDDGTAYTYVLLLTGRREKGDLVAGMDAGADDYVAKPFDEHELRVRLRAGRRIVDLQGELHRLKEGFRHQSRTDPLTGCLNRRGVMERLAAEMSRARRDGSPVGVAMLDLDHFKRINDVHGHAAGDAVLCELVRRVQQRMRGSDVLGRVGGEEFLMVCPGAGLDGSGALVAADALRVLVGGRPFSIGASALPVTASLGVTITWGGETTDEVVSRADAALYAAKRAGRDRVEHAPLPGSTTALAEHARRLAAPEAGTVAAGAM
jgi:diguanylate cyclase (GGDEF)-like protein